MLREYIEKALTRMTVEKMEDGEYFASIEGFDGVWGSGATEQEARNQASEVLEEWLVVKLRDDDDDLPVLDGIDLNFGGKKWAQRHAASSSGN